MERIFYPIGQGAFYAERFTADDGGVFNVVYDCGVLHPSKSAENIVSQSFTKSDTIDVLFISHLDYDHVSLVKKLKDSTRQINRVILPLTNKNVILGIYKCLNYGKNKYSDFISLLENPQHFFGQETRVYYVESSENVEGAIEQSAPIDIDDLNNFNTIKNGAVLKCNKMNSDWIFIPFNYAFNSRRVELENLLKLNGLSVDDVDVSKNTLKNIVSNRKIIKEIYEEITGGINENSMFLYSGPNSKGVGWNFVSFFSLCGFPSYRYKDRHILFKPACIYCGDGDLNKVQIESVFMHWMDLVGTIQIPHHGSLSNFNINRIPCHTICLISVGKNNYFGHPSYTVIGELKSKCCLPVCVTEDSDSGLVEIIPKYKMVLCVRRGAPRLYANDNRNTIEK